MPIETPVNGIWDLDASNPTSGDPRSEGDDHMRLIKSAIKKTFPNIDAIINASDEELTILFGAIITTQELNQLNGITSNIQTQIDSPLIARTNIANIFTALQTISNTLLQDSTGPNLDVIHEFYNNGSNNGGGYVQNVNSATTGYIRMTRRVATSASNAAYVIVYENGRVELASIINSSGNTATLGIRDNGSILIAPASGTTATYKGSEVATAADISGLTQTATVMGTILSGQTIPPPPGYTAAQTSFMVAISDAPIISGNPSIRQFQCSVDINGITTGSLTYDDGTINFPLLNYIAVGTK